MSSYSFKIYAPGNFSSLPAEDGTQRSALEPGDTIVFNGGGEVATVTVDDPSNSTFSEIETDQTLVDPITFDGVSYSVGQQVTPSYIIEFAGSDGKTYTMVSFNFDVNDSGQVPDAVFWVGGTPPPDGTSLTVLSETNPIVADAPEYPPPCYAPGTMIDTLDGPRPVETLQIGDLVETLDHGPQAIRWTSCRTHPLEDADTDAKPVQIKAGALGRNLPAHDLIVSRQHRILVGGGGQLHQVFASEVFAPAKSLTRVPGIRHMKGKAQITWIHFTCGQHEVVTANGCLSESLLLGPMVVNGLTAPERQAVTEVFGLAPTPDAAVNGPPARECLTVGAVKRQIAKHLKDKGQFMAKEIRKWDRDLAMEKYEVERLREAVSMAQPREKALRVA
jgi:hypothetical protein